jgi:hypothetical protein
MILVLFNQLSFSHLMSYFASITITTIISKPCEDEKRILEELIAKHMTEQLKRVLQLSTKPRLLVIQSYAKCVYITDLFQATN